MRWGVVAIVLVAACQNAGVSFVVDTSAMPDVALVRLYLGAGDGRDAALSSEGFEPADPARAGVYYVQDVDGAVDTARVTGPGRYEFVYTAPPGAGPLSAIAVGFDAQDKAIAQAAVFDVDVPADQVVVWTLALEQAAPARPGATGRQVQVWGDAPGTQTCVQAVNPDATHPIAYVVASEEDKDCDGFGKSDPLECDDLYFRAHPTVASGPTCITQTPIVVAGAPMSVCSLGISGCVDGSAQGRDVCKATPRYCASDETCMRCADLDCALGSWEINASAYKCTIEVTRDGQGKPVPCMPSLAIAPLAGGLACPAPATRFYSSEGNRGWAPSVDVFGMRLAFSATPTCGTVITPSLPAAGMLESTQPFGGLVDITASTGNHIILPVSFTFAEVQQCRPEVVCAPMLAFPSNLQPTCVDPAILPPQI